MATTDDFVWDAPPLSPDDQRLIDTYVRVGRPVDMLPYTDDFETLYREVASGNGQQPTRHDVFVRLLALRKMARLPRLIRAL